MSDAAVSPVIAVDVGATKLAAALVDESGATTRRLRRDTPAGQGGVLGAVVDLARALLDAARADGLQPVGIGIGSAGQIDVRRGAVAFATGTMPGWSGAPVAATVGEATGLPVAVDNDGNAFALGEAWLGAGRGHASVFGVAVGTGIGGGIVIDGRVIAGARFWAGNVGHLRVEHPGMQCNCGGHGCLETRSAGWGIACLADGELGSPPVGVSAWTAKLVAERAAAGDPAARRLLRQAGEHLGRALAACSVLLDPGCFVVGGSVASGSPLILDACRDAYRDCCSLPGLASTRILPAALGDDAVLAGAARLAFLAAMGADRSGRV